MTGPWDDRDPSGTTPPSLPPHLDPRGRRHARRAEAARGPAERMTATPVRLPRASRSARRAAAGSTGAHGAVVGVKIVSAALSIALLAYIGYAWNTVRGLNNNAQRLTISAIGGGSTNAATGAVSHRYDIDGQSQNILIAGNDDRTTLTDAQVKELKVGRDGGSLNTDTLMIIHVPADGSAATLISLPRDSYVAIPGYGMNRINAAYSDGYYNASGNADAKRAAGADLLIQTVQNLTGLNIDHFVLVSLLGFVTISDAVGGVPVNLCHSVNDTVAYNKSIGSDGGSGFHMSKGHHVIQGVTALEFVRQRHNLPNGDLDRTARQRYFLTAAFRKVASAGTLLNPSRLSGLVKAVNQSVYVDSGLNMLDLAKQMSNLSANNIKGEAIPFQGFENVTINGYLSNVEHVDPAQVKAFVEGMIGSTDSAYTSAKAVSPSDVTVSVVNAGAANGAATAATKTLAGAGFHASVGPDGSAQQATTIEYPSGDEAAAKTLAQYVPGAAVEQTSNVDGVTLLVTSDGVTVHGGIPSAGSTTTHGTSTHKRHRAAHKKALDSGCIN